MKVLVGTFEIGRHIYDLGEGLRMCGHDVTTVVQGRNPYYRQLRYDVYLGEASVAELIREHEVFIFQFGQSLLPSNRDMPVIKDGGGRIISIFNGSDIRHHSAAGPVSAHYGFRLPSMCYEAPFNDINARQHPLRVAEMYADAILSLPFQSEMALRPYHHFYIALDLGLYDAEIPLRKKPLLIHAPSRRRFKGTDIFIEVLSELASEGVEFDFELLEATANDVVLDRLAEADIVLDELNAPHYGMLSLEAMASGCAVLSGKSFDYVPGQGFSPVIGVTTETLKSSLRRAIEDIDYREGCARRGLAFVERHDQAAVASYTLASMDTTPHYWPTYAHQLWDRPPCHPAIDQMSRAVAESHGTPDQWVRPPSATVELWGYSPWSHSVDGYHHVSDWCPVTEADPRASAIICQKVT